MRVDKRQLLYIFIVTSYVPVFYFLMDFITTKTKTVLLMLNYFYFDIMMRGYSSIYRYIFFYVIGRQTSKWVT